MKNVNHVTICGAFASTGPLLSANYEYDNYDDDE
jgi:hypothetical protein